MPISGYFDQVFANAGDLTPVPDAVQSSGNVSYAQGYGPLYQTPVASGGIDIERAKMNQIFNDITMAIQQYQQHGTPTFITATMNGGTAYSYSQYDRVLLGGVVYWSLINANTDTPPSVNWSVAPLISTSVGQCLLQYSSTTQVFLAPKNGNHVSFPSGIIQNIGGGITATSTSCYLEGAPSSALGASTKYYVYLNAGGSPYLNFSTTGYTADSVTGIVIKSGDPTQVLVGAVITNSSSQFYYSVGNISTAKANIGVRSWFNDTGVNLSNSFTATVSTNSNTFAEVSNSIRCTALLWANEIVTASLVGTTSSDTAGDGSETAIGIDSTSTAQPGYSTATSPATAYNFPASAASPAQALSEGLHYFTMLGNNSNGISTGGNARWNPMTILTVQSRR